MGFEPSLLGWIHPCVLVFGSVSLLVPVSCDSFQHLGPSKNAHCLSKMNEWLNSLSACARLPSPKPMIECARHAHALVQIHKLIFVLVLVNKFVFIIALFQCIQVSVFFDVPEYWIHHDTGFIIRDVCNHCFIRYGIILVVQNIIFVFLGIRL